MEIGPGLFRVDTAARGRTLIMSDEPTTAHFIKRVGKRLESPHFLLSKNCFARSLPYAIMWQMKLGLRSSFEGMNLCFVPSHAVRSVAIQRRGPTDVSGVSVPLVARAQVGSHDHSDGKINCT